MIVMSKGCPVNYWAPFFGVKFMQLDKNMWGYYYE